MHEYAERIYASVCAKDPTESEFHQAVLQFLQSVSLAIESHPEYESARILERMVEPERVVIFRVPWVDDQGEVRINRGFRVQMNSAIGPYKGGLRFHPSVNLGVLKFLAFEQVFKNALTTLPLGAGKGGADFDPKEKSESEVMRFCQSFISELFRHLGPDTDVPAGDIGVGSREIGYLFGHHKRLTNEFSGVLTGKGVGWGGSYIRPEATGYGLIYLAVEMLATRGEGLAGKTCLVSGSGNVALSALQKIIQLGGKPVTASDSNGFVYDETGFDEGKLAHLMHIKNIRRGRVVEFTEEYPHSVYTPFSSGADSSPQWDLEADCAFPCATQNEINERDAQNLLRNGVQLVAEGANMPTTPEAARAFVDSRILYAPDKAANAGGVATSGLEMSQDSLRMSWSREEVDDRLHLIMKRIHAACLDAAAAHGTPGNYVNGANIVGFVKVADAMMAQGVV